MSSCLKTENLSCGYDGNIVLAGVSLEIEGGRIHSIIGPNGSGKTTLLKTLYGGLEKIGGTVMLEGEELFKIPPREIARRVSLVLTNRYRGDYITCREVVESGRFPYTGGLGILSGADIKTVEDCLAATETSEIADRDFTKISDGQRQRVMLARALAQEPRLMILDEPTSFLDIKYQLGFLRLLKELSKKKDFAVLMSLHELDLARQISDKIICIKDGGVDRVGTAGEIFSGGYVAGLFGLAEEDFNEATGQIRL